jgi:hypothetical protein
MEAENNVVLPSPLRVAGPQPQHEALLAQIMADYAGTETPVNAEAMSALIFGGEAECGFPPLWFFAPAEEAPARITQTYLWTGATLPPRLLEQLSGLPCHTVPSDLSDDWQTWAEAFAVAEFVLTDQVRLAALANGMLKPALFVSDYAAETQVCTLPFTLGCTRSGIATVLAGFDRDETMPDLLNWKRITQQRLRRTLTAPENA